MNQKKNIFRDYFPFHQNREQFFNRIMEEGIPVKRILTLFLILNGLMFIYGLSMGSHHSILQALVTGIKMVLLFSLALLICFPAFFIIQSVLGSKLRLSQMMIILLSGFVLIASIMVSFVPITIFFQLTGGNYYFLILLHLIILGLSAFFGMKAIIDALQYSCEKKNIYPKIGVSVFRFWIIILAFVGVQLAWNLRPFLGKKNEPFQLFRQYEGNFYTAIVYSIRQLWDNDDTRNPERIKSKDNPLKEDRPLRLYFNESEKKH